jgi:hypothetical protein
MRVPPIAAVALVLALCSVARGACGESLFPAKALETRLVYRNTEYGFCFALPADWNGFKVIASRWTGNGNGSSESGPKFIVRNPRWTPKKPYQDIPILVFTPAQWRAIENEEFNVSAAPIGPSELGRNSKYVFALPPRFAGFDDAVGTAEVLELLQQKPFEAPCSKRPKPDSQQN